LQRDKCIPVLMRCMDFRKRDQSIRSVNFIDWSCFSASAECIGLHRHILYASVWLYLVIRLYSDSFTYTIHNICFTLIKHSAKIGGFAKQVFLNLQKNIRFVGIHLIYIIHTWNWLVIIVFYIDSVISI